ncbi:MAG: DNA polymerase III subunit gamma and tau [Actinomycetes bacterium]
MEAPLALYRRYRPETFAEVIGQDHVTAPLRAALRNNRVNHAYLFSGPRGCGKTTSARILARCLNCAQGSTDEPCGTCQSCTDLARGGPGSIDVIEIDAASHGGVDDARDLREKAFFAPVNSRYKVYIIDEAHMVTTQGFNALLKLVEEPPPHLKFIFATTEPEKVIGTIRSRTHHYPFRLIPPRTLSDYLQQLCAQEGVSVDPAALPLVVRSGGGSARDTLSVLDQLIGGAGDEGVTYALATGLLGYTPESLLDEVVEAFAAGDGATVFGVIDKVIETGQDPRRFTEDLLRRLRDLLIIAAVPDAPATGLVDAPADLAERLVAQSARFGRVELSRAADLVAQGLTELKGATAPRLLLELICARVLLPGADHTTEGVMARLDRLERRVQIEGVPAAAPRGPAEPSRGESPEPKRGESPAPTTPAAPPASTPPAAPPRTAVPAPTGGGDDGRPAGPTPEVAPGEVPPAPAASHDQAARPAAEATPSSGSGSGGALGLVEVRRLWPDLIDKVKSIRRVTWIHLSQEAQVVGVDEKTLTLGFRSQSARSNFMSGGHEEILRQAAIDVIGHDWRVEAVVDPSAQPGVGIEASGPRSTYSPSRPGDAGTNATIAETGQTGQTGPTGAAGGGTGPTDVDRPGPAPAPPPDGGRSPSAEPPADAGTGVAPAPSATPTAGPTTAPRRPVAPSAVASARDAIQDTRPAGSGRAAPASSVSDDEVSPDDPDADDDLAGAELLARELGAQVIEEIKHD